MHNDKTSYSNWLQASLMHGTSNILTFEDAVKGGSIPSSVIFTLAEFAKNKTTQEINPDDMIQELASGKFNPKNKLAGNKKQLLAACIGVFTVFKDVLVSTALVIGRGYTVNVMLYNFLGKMDYHGISHSGSADLPEFTATSEFLKNVTSNQDVMEPKFVKNFSCVVSDTETNLRDPNYQVRINYITNLSNYRVSQ